MDHSAGIDEETEDLEGRDLRRWFVGIAEDIAQYAESEQHSASIFGEILEEGRKFEFVDMPELNFGYRRHVVQLLLDLENCIAQELGLAGL